MVQWIRLHAPNAGDVGSTPGKGTGSRMLQLRPSAAKSINQSIFLKTKKKIRQQVNKLDGHNKLKNQKRSGNQVRSR